MDKKKLDRQWIPDSKRLQEGLSGKEILAFSRRFIANDFVDVYSMDNIDMNKIKGKVANTNIASCIINTSDADEIGEHWVAIYINSGKVEYFDSYGLPPIQSGVQNLCHTFATEYEWNDQPVQDIMDQKSVACGYHALFYLYAKQCEPNMKLSDIINKYYDSENARHNDLFAICFIENKKHNQ